MASYKRDSSLERFLPPNKLIRSAYCSNQNLSKRDFTKSHAASKVAEDFNINSAAEMIESLPGHDGCALFTGYTMQEPFQGVALLGFSRDRFYRISSEINTNGFDELERSLVGALGKPTSRKIGTAQNGFGASFEMIDDFWQVGPVAITLRKRTHQVDEG